MQFRSVVARNNLQLIRKGLRGEVSLRAVLQNMTARDLDAALGVWWRHGPYHLSAVHGETIVDWLTRSYPGSIHNNVSTIGTLYAALILNN